MLDDEITIDRDADTITIFGIKYALSLFRSLAVEPIGSSFRIAQREAGTVILETLTPEAERADR